jgi:hypothetical protein
MNAKRSLLRWLAPIVTLSVCWIAACGGVQTASFSGDPGRRISLAEWCRTMADVSCDRWAQCNRAARDANDACVTRTIESCLGGRDEGQASGHNGGDLKRCADTLGSAECDGYTETVASHAECRAGASEASN